MNVQSIISLLVLKAVNKSERVQSDTKELILILDGLNVTTLSREAVEKLEDINARQRTWIRWIFDLNL
jgi:hypothetical protein